MWPSGARAELEAIAMLDASDPDYAAVERTLDIVPCTRALAGPIADVLARGCESLGMSHGPTRRNARECTAQGFCDFGCARGARRSVDIAYLPGALARGAVVVTNTSVDRVVLERGRAVGVAAITRTGRRIQVHARAVVCAAGALQTPRLLARSPVGRALPALGRHLRLQPSAGIGGVMPERIDGFSHVAQGWASEALLDSGVLLVAAQHDASLAATVLGSSGARLRDALDHAPRMATLGVLAADLESEGRLALDVAGHVVARYRLRRADRLRLERGLVTAAKVLTAAGATRLLPFVQGASFFDGERGRDALIGGGLAGRRMRLVSFHPMGTARMASSVRDGVVGPDHRVFGTRGLYVTDASALPGPLGVNPQLAIMAMARRAARIVDDELTPSRPIRRPAMSFSPRTIIEPFRVKMVEPLPFRTRRERAARLEEARYNLFGLHAEDVTIDLMTDSGTSAMSQDHWAEMIRGDESYAGSRSFYALQSAVREITGLEHVIPTHQGRAAEHILFSTIAASRPAAAPGVVVSNSHFDTTRANVEASGMRAVDLPIAEARQPSSEHPFKGDIDLMALDALLAAESGKVPLVLLTITSNSVGGQPVSLANAHGAKAICDRHGVPLFVDCARFAENAWLVREREPGARGRTPTDIALEMFQLVDGALMSSKKDAFGNIGGFLALRDPTLAERCRQALVLTEGFPTYGGLAGRDLAALAVGLREVLDERYLEYRIASIAYLFDRLDRAGVPLLRPAGGHAVYLDARTFLPHVPPGELPGQAVSLSLYLEAGIRSVEIGTAMFGHTRPDGTQEPAPLDLVRLAIPRRAYTQSHMDYVAEAVAYVYGSRHRLGGYRIVDEPSALRHFTCGFAPLRSPVSDTTPSVPVPSVRPPHAPDHEAALRRA